MSELIIEMADCQNQLLREIAEPTFKRRHIAETYALAMRSSECSAIDWARVNQAIIARWSLSALEWIKRRAHSGRCFQS